MTEREKELLRLAVAYLIVNWEEAIESFAYINDDSYGCLCVNGEIMPEPTVEEHLKLFHILD